MALNFLPLISSTAIANNRKEKYVSEIIGQKMNDIGGANIVILKQLTIKKVESNYKSYTYLITTTT